ncbi:unnamed protein product [Mesocestoides corti]|uniref:Uncharacterized protein n=1 Tax=Mesocestoides corti TaxID=53468 RepID=A0A0R3U9Y2_MESCO|nr:unnamed protein product [Mesocestoides corti]
MSLPMKPSASKSDKLTRQSNVINGGAHSQSKLTTPDSPVSSLTPCSPLLLHMELPKPISRLPEIRLEGGSGRGASKAQTRQVIQQKSCESYDSAASGMSWSSSQSTNATWGNHCNSGSVCGGYLSFARHSEEENPQGYQHQKSVAVSPTGFSSDEEHKLCEASSEDLSQSKNSEEADERSRSPLGQTGDFYDSVFDDQEKVVI